MSREQSNANLKRLCRWWVVASVFAYAGLMAFAFPWWQVANHPVLFTLEAPAETLIELDFGAGEAPLQLVPLDEPSEGARQWGTELPPRRGYDLALYFPGGTPEEVTLSGMRILVLSPKRADLEPDLAGLEANGGTDLRVERTRSGWSIEADPGARLELPVKFPQVSTLHWLGDWITFTLGFSALAGILLLILVTAIRFPDEVRGKERHIPFNETLVLLLCLVTGSLLHLYLVGFSMPDYWPADSTSYTMKAVSLVTEGSYDTGTHEYELNRMPGFPLFMALVFKVAGWDLNAVAFAQGLLFCLSVTLLTLSMRKLVYGYYLGLCSLCVLASPPAVWASRQIATESTFASMWILGLAAFLYLWQRKRNLRWTGWVLFGLATTAAVAIRPNGILLLALPGMLFLGTLWWALSCRGFHFYKQAIVWRTVLQVTVPCLMVLLFVLAWSWRNHESRGYGKPTDLTEIVYANAPFFAGIFDIRAARDGEEYAWFVNERARSNYWFHGWSLRKYRFRVLTDNYTRIENESITELDRQLAEFNEASGELIPLRARIAGWGRVAGWGLWFPEIGAYTTDPLNQNYEILTRFPGTQRREHITRNLAWAARHVEREIEIRETGEDPLIERYNATVAAHYGWLYRLLLGGALAGWACALMRQKYAAAAFVLPYVLNILLNVYFLYVIGRYVQILDASLWMGALTGLAGLSVFSLQKRIPENERRCITPRKPRRLLTRFVNIPGTAQQGPRGSGR